MTTKRLPLRDPRTVARDIPGFLDVIFPRLNGGLVASMNRSATSFDDIEAIPSDLIEGSNLQSSMLFELAVVRAEQILLGDSEGSWDECVKLAVSRQSRHFDASVPDQVADGDRELAELSANNLVSLLNRMKQNTPNHELKLSPSIPGMGWINSSVGDFALGPILIEVKYTNRNFVSRDYKQILMYWILNYAASLESGDEAWQDCVLLNPRRNSAVLVNFDSLLKKATSGLHRLEVLELMRAMLANELEKR